MATALLFDCNNMGSSFYHELLWIGRFVDPILVSDSRTLMNLTLDLLWISVFIKIGRSWSGLPLDNITPLEFCDSPLFVEA
jgi:hypothetical protein